MPGPAPKDPSTRQRRNKNSTAAQLKADPNLEIPELPRRMAWNDQTRAWWADVWSSPMAPEFDESDRHGLNMLAVLVDDYWMAANARERMPLAAEIRQQSQRFGLSPIDRRRLQWEIERTEEAQRRGARSQPAPATPANGGSDPRSTLRAV